MSRRHDNSQGGAIFLVARATVVEVLRGKVAWLIGASAVLLLVGGVGLRDLHFGGAHGRFLIDVGFGTIGLGGTVLATFGTALLFFGELDNRLWQFVLARPVTRASWLLGKYLGVCVIIGAYTAVMAAVLLALLFWAAGVGGMEITRGIIAGAAGLWLRASLIAAGTLFFCAYARSALFATGAALLAVLVGHLRPFADQWEPGTFAGGLLIRVMRAWPDLQAFEPTEVSGMSLRLVAYGLGYVAILMTAAGWAFRRREL